MTLVSIFLAVWFLWIVWSSFEGMTEAIYYDVAVEGNRVKEIHWLYVIKRGCVWLSVGSLSYLLAGFTSLLFDISLLMIFSFFHNGFYYVVRNKLDKNIYKKGFVDSSTTSTAKIELNFSFRLQFFLIGFLLMISFLYNIT